MGDQVLIRCLCGHLTETVQLQGSIPVDNILCHCSSCRHRTGALTFSGLKLASPPVTAFTTKLVKYTSSDRLWEYFCETCGSHVCYYVVKEDRWSVCSGVVDQVFGDKQGKLENFTTHEYAGDTKDGGFLPLFPGTTVYLEDDGGKPVSDWRNKMMPWQDNNAPDATGTMQGACHCGQVKLSVSRPQEGDDGSKWDAGLCVCRTCRLACGQSLVPWAFNIPFGKVLWPNGTSLSNELHESLRRFQSSDHAHRDFCKICGASVFYFSSKMPGEVDIAFGLLRAREGSLARSCFKWETDKIHHPEDAIDEDLIALIQGNIRFLND